MWKGRLLNRFLSAQQQGYASVGPAPYPDGVEIIDCALGTNPLGMAGSLRLLLEGFGGLALDAYPEPEPGSLKEGIVASHPGWRLEAGNILLGGGSMGVLTVLAQLLTGPGDRFLGFSPQFTEGALQFVFRGAEYLRLPMKRPHCAISPDALLSEMERQRPALLYLDRPNNPTGQLLPLEALRSVAGRALELGCWVISDEAYGDFIPDEESAACLDLPNLVTCRSFSKGMGLAGLRVGFAVARDAGLVKAFGTLQPPFVITTPAALMAREVLRDAAFIEKSRQYVREAKERIVGCIGKKRGWALAETDLRVPIMLLSLEEGDLFRLLGGAGIACEPGVGFFDLDERAARLRVPAPGQLEAFLQRLASL